MKSNGFWLCVLTLGLLIVGSVMGQLQQSGGPGSTVTATQSGTWTVQPGNTPNSTAWKVDGSGVTQPVSGTFWQATQPVSGTVTVNALPAGSNVIGTVNTIPKTACGNTLAAGSALAAVPTSSTLLTSAATACVVAAIFHNPTSGALTVTLTDNTGTPVNALLTFSIPAFSSLVEPLYGSSFNLGVKWAASGSGVTGSVVAYQ